MNQYLPRLRKEKAYYALPPGFNKDLNPRPDFDVKTTMPLNMLYVGGVDPTVYDISALMRVVGGRNDVTLTVCCREDEWRRYNNIYHIYSSDNINIVHVNADELSAYYHAADVFLMVMEYSEYRDFAMPVKFSEAVGYAVPVITMNQKEVANRVLSDDIGWVLDEFTELDGLLSKLVDNRELLANKHQNILTVRDSYQWSSRASMAAKQLLSARLK